MGPDYNQNARLDQEISRLLFCFMIGNLFTVILLNPLTSGLSTMYLTEPSFWWYSLIISLYALSMYISLKIKNLKIGLIFSIVFLIISILVLYPLDSPKSKQYLETYSIFLILSPLLGWISAKARPGNIMLNKLENYINDKAGTRKE
jgi:hypothetical protein